MLRSPQGMPVLEIPALSRLNMEARYPATALNRLFCSWLVGGVVCLGGFARHCRLSKVHSRV